MAKTKVGKWIAGLLAVAGGAWFITRRTSALEKIDIGLELFRVHKVSLLNSEMVLSLRYSNPAFPKLDVSD